MTDMEILRKLVSVGAVACNVEESRALGLLERLTGTTKPAQNPELFDELCGILGHTKMEYTPARANKLKLRLKRYSKDVMLEVARAIANNDYMAGSSGRKYGTIDYLLRNDEKIDEWHQHAIEAIQKKAKAAERAKVPDTITQAAEVKRADPAAVAAAKAKLYEKLRRK